MMKRGIAIFFVLGCAMFLSRIGDCRAQEIFETRNLSFGTFAIVDNDASHTIIVAPDNTVTYDPSIVPNIEGERGHYTFTDLPPNVIFYLGVNVANPPAEGGLILDNQTDVSTGGGQVFTLSNFTANAANEMVTNGDGDATLYIGATLTTSGNSGVYNDGVYNGQLDLTLYW